MKFNVIMFFLFQFLIFNCKGGDQVQSMRNAIETDDINTVIQILNDGFFVDAPINPVKDTALISAIMYERYIIAEMLIMRGANVNHQNIHGESILGTALLYYELYGRDGITKLLINHKSDTLHESQSIAFKEQIATLSISYKH